MSLQQAFVLHTPASLKWTAAQEKSLSRDYPFQDHDAADPALFVQRTYLHFLWLPHSIMPLSLFIPSLLRIRGTPDLAEDQPHPLHTFIEPLLLSLRAAANKYHNELPQILADGGGAGEAEESMMWYALGYEKVDGSAERNEHLTGEDNAMLEEKWRLGWLECMEQREVQIQILLYFLKLSLPGPCTPLPPVEVPPTDNISFISPVKPSRLRKKKKEKPNLIIPSSIERLESFMDKLSMWQLVSLMNTSRTEIATRNKNECDWMQKFCEDVVEPLFKSKLPEQCALLHSKLFPNSPFSDEPPSPGPSTGKSLHGSRSHYSSSTTATGSQSGMTTGAPARTRSLSISLAQEKEKERAASVGATQDKALQRALTRQISMSRTWKGKDRSTATVSQKDTKMPAATAKRIIGRTDSQSQSSQSRAAPAITLVTATPVKKPPPRAKSNASARSSSPHLTGRSSSPLIARSSSLTLLDTDDNELPCASVPLLDFSSDSLGNVMEEDEDAEEEIWLPNSSPDVLLLGKSGWGISAKKRVPSAASQVLHPDTPVRKRMKLEE
ncbi:uncharacterized protein F5891DRAFT_1013549 [Suillus fuscotomentosus]|uniref:DNA replication regulator Sld3 C-terminal domain-containing protein n=1 Tax=Suillus fuscotomentosus TaxID=1912939 RepID=A0AAD4HPJ2_9AGAM|nr:uncharacterized protein F5891DRAFT_1013549 [Suillus fuscotomentosus]KAG1904243.1 hypothetical protein F5891DRAFT_1013549 [Suillus fuscotomentosus]